MIETANAKTNTKLSDAQLDRMVDQMFSLAGMEGKSSLKFEDFQKLFHQNGDLLNDVSLDWKGNYQRSRIICKVPMIQWVSQCQITDCNIHNTSRNEIGESEIEGSSTARQIVQFSWDTDSWYWCYKRNILSYLWNYEELCPLRAKQ